jgi:hypothetical protein
MNRKQKFQTKMLALGLFSLILGSLSQLGYGYPNNAEEKGFIAGAFLMCAFWCFFLLYISLKPKKQTQSKLGG